jgi:D-3-phosphoglycerate dehydrogenase
LLIAFPFEIPKFGYLCLANQNLLFMPLPHKVLITDHVHPLLIEGLSAAGYDCVLAPKAQQKEVEALIPEYHGLIINSKIQVNASFLQRATQLRFIARLGSGLEIIDTKSAQQLGITVHRSPEGNCEAVAEHALGMLLSWHNHLCRANTQVKQGIWQREANRGRELMNQCIALLGFGHTGQALARRLMGFGMEILVYDKYLAPGFAQAFPQVREASLEEIQQNADILSLHLPLTDETKGWINLSFLQQFRKPLVLLNTARGELLPLTDLVQALDQGWVRGACLDVLEHENPSTYSETEALFYPELFQREQILLSPHVAGWTVESKKRLSQILLEKILGHRPSELPNWALGILP